MEEKINDIVLPDFDEWLENYKPPVLKYNAAFDIDSGKLITVGPEHAVNDKTYKNVIGVDSHVAEDIISGKIKMSRCFVDPAMEELQIVEVKQLYTIDDVLHRIIEKPWSEVEKADIHLTYNKSKKMLYFKLSEEFGGTHKLDKKYHPITKRKIFWDGETEMSFIVTDYNDPHIIHDTIKITVADISDKTHAVSVNFPDLFSIYTRRLFKNYMIEVI